MQRRLIGKGIGLRRGEQGQTILLVAISIVALLAMAALAIDVVSLYVSKSEIQRAADAVALAGAKAIADSGVTTLASSDPNLPNAQILAQNMATSAINAMLSVSAGNLVSGQAPTLFSGGTINWSQGNNNPTITVTLQQTNLPTFFARIFAQTSAMTQATATAEVYNPANMQPEFTPIARQCVKPWLMANRDPTQEPAWPQLIDPATGTLEATVASLIGNNLYLTADCDPTQPRNRCSLIQGPDGQPLSATRTVYYLPATVGSTNNIYPSCAASADGYVQSVAGCDSTVYSCGGTTPNASWDSTENPAQGTGGGDANSDTAQGAECLLGLNFPGSTGMGLGQDSIAYPLGWPASPPTITVNSGGQNGSVVSTSGSIVTIPIFNSINFNNAQPVTVIGFLQGFINCVGNPCFTSSSLTDYGDVSITVMNVVGCGQTPNGNNPVVGGNGVSAIPVRLITPP